MLFSHLLLAALTALGAEAVPKKKNQAVQAPVEYEPRKRCSTTLTLDNMEDPVVVSRCDQPITVSTSEYMARITAECRSAGLCEVIPGAEPVTVDGPTQIETRVAVESALIQRYEDLDNYEREWRRKRAMPGFPMQTPCPGVAQQCWQCGQPQMCCNSQNVQAFKTNFMVPFPTFTVVTTVTTYDLPTWTVQFDATVTVQSPAVSTITTTSYTTSIIEVNTTIVVTPTPTVPPLAYDSPNFELQFPLPEGYVFSKKRASEPRAGPPQSVFVRVDANGDTFLSPTSVNNYTLISGSLFTEIDPDGQGAIQMMSVLNASTWSGMNYSNIIFDADPPPTGSAGYFVIWGLAAENNDTNSPAAVWTFAGQTNSTGNVISIEQVLLCINNNTMPGAKRLFFVPHELPGVCDTIAPVAQLPSGSGGNVNPSSSSSSSSSRLPSATSSSSGSATPSPSAFGVCDGTKAPCNPQ